MESVKLKERIRLLEEEVEHLQSQLSSANFEVRQLHDEARSLERIIDEERASLTEFKAEAEATMVAKKIEVEDLYKKANLLERKVEEERAISAGLAASREEMETQLESAHLEVKRLQDMVSSLRQEVDEEKPIFLQMSTKKQEDKIMLRKERDFVMSSEMFVACQKTIDSISQQLKSLSNFENLMIESEGVGCHLQY
ncbi:centrosomal protein of 83 kDa-like [Phalaenopsis equestris]|uniref:centrosomal protein of 83 kDa-like n=1 Tax=Phalaenopsis equestris TaxID=78828 RepID=UPI0009E3FDD9|nr:centrosomal protein of 83 kDa-like [Phalaenopsis equestris]